MAMAAVETLLRRVTTFSFLIHVLLLCFGTNTTVSQSKITSLPGFDGPLPFDLETGYVGIGESNDIQLYYYFVKSEKNSQEDPLLLWIDGGPGCSSFCGLAFEIGPLNFRKAEYNGSLPTLELNLNSWTKVANVLFLDSPVGTGFSYSTTLEGYHTGDIKSAQQTYAFLRKWLINHPEFIHAQFYIAGLSYSGLSIPSIVQTISDGNDAGNTPYINIKGYLLGNAGTDRHVELNSQVPYAHRMGLISDELYESVKKNCDGEYINVDPSNKKCTNDIHAVKQCTSNVNIYHILEPICATESIEPQQRTRTQRVEDIITEPENAPNNFVAHFPVELEKYFLDEYSSEVPASPPPLPRNPVLECRTYGYKLAYYWMNNESVQKALHVRKGTVDEWIRCKLDIPYTNDFSNTVHYHVNFNSRGLRSLIYSGDHDMQVPYIGTQEWIRSVNFSIINDWRPWYVGGQVAGYTRMYSNNLTFATVKGGGHEVPMYKPKECFAMFKRWISHNPL